MSDPAASSMPQTFVRRIDTPPGAPWDQARAARLDAVHGAPLGAGDLIFAVKRIAPWAPRAAGEFAVAYLHREQVPEGHVAARIGDREHRFRFRTPEAVRRQILETVITGGLIATAAIILTAAGLRAQSVRQANADLLVHLEANAARSRRIHAQEEAARADAALLARAGADPRGLAGVAEDLLWLGRAKAPSVQVQRVRWTPAALQVVSQGPGPPVLGLERSVIAEGAIADAQEWRIEAPPPQVVRAGVRRPSVVGARPQRPNVR